MRQRFNADAKLGAWLSAILLCSKLRQVNNRDPECLRKALVPTSRQGIKVFPQGLVMQCAQHLASIAHNAYQHKRCTLLGVANDSTRQARRRAALEILIAEAGGVTALQERTGTPKSHFSAITSGRRGVGDALAAKLEDVMGRPPGWMDRDLGGLSPRALRIATLWDAMPEGVEKERAYAVSLTLMSGDLRDALPMPQLQTEPTPKLHRAT